MRKFLVGLMLSCGAIPTALAHHGVAGVGAGGLYGPGAPVESATSQTLPDSKLFAYFKVDNAQFRTFDSDPANPEGDYSNFFIVGGGYGFKPWLSGYLFVPINEKTDEPGGFDTRGVADISLFGQVGVTYDRGLRLIPANESLDDIEDWHFTVFGGLTIPTGEANERDHDGNIDFGKSNGFGKPSYSIGLTATKSLSPSWSFNQELSYLYFDDYTYDDGNNFQFGGEIRANSALSYRVYTNEASKFRVDLNIEAQYLGLGRDKLNGRGERATGGDIVYLLPGVRVYYRSLSAALGVKREVWTALNEESEQQGAEGKEDYRLIFSISVLF